MGDLSKLSDEQLKEYYRLYKNCGTRAEDVKVNLYSTKYAYHLVRLMDEVEQILNEGDLDLEKNRGRLKAIRRGEWTEDRVREYFEQKEKLLEDAYHKSPLPHKPRESELKELLLNCLEQYFGTLKGALVREDTAKEALRNILKICEETLPREYESQMPIIPQPPACIPPPIPDSGFIKKLFRKEK